MNPDRNSQPCPSFERLAQFALGKLPERELEPIGRHSDSCPTCQAILDELDRRLDDLLARLRAQVVGLGASRKSNSESHVQLDRVVERLIHLTLQPNVKRDRDWMQWVREASGTGDGDVVIGGFRLLSVIGVGGMGVVFQAEDEDSHRPVALKVMRPEVAADEWIRNRFRTEAQSLATLVHDCVVKVYKTGCIAELPFLAMEFLEGESLARRLVRDPALTLDEILQVGRQTAEGLAVAHRRELIHRDVKPGNIFLQGTAKRFQVKLLDFGLVRDGSRTDRPDDRGWVLGTPAFMSPEQTRGEPAGKQSDLFSLGCVLYRMLSGRLPFDASTSQEMLQARENGSPTSLRILLPTLPSRLTELVDQLLASDPERRPHSAAEVVRRLERIATPRVTRRTVLSAVTVVCVMIGAWSLGSLFAPRAGLSPLDPAWFDRARKLPPDDQMREVAAEMQRRNPRWDGRLEFEAPVGSVIACRFSPRKVRDVAPLRSLVELERLSFPGEDKQQGTVSDLSPLSGLSLRELDVGSNPIPDFSPLRDMPLATLRAKSTRVADLRPLAGMPLRVLQLAETQVEDLSPIRDCPLRSLSFWNTRVRDLEPLRNMQTLERLECERTRVSDLSPLRGLRLKYLACEQSPIADYTILREFPLEELHISYDPRKHRELLRSIPTLKWINYQPADEVLK